MYTWRLRKLLPLAVILTLTAVADGRANIDKEEGYSLQLDPRGVDAEVRRSLLQVINEGAAKFNNGDHAGCCATFQHALQSALPRLGHHPQIQSDIRNGLADADTVKPAVERAFKLRAVLDKVRNDLKASESRPPR
jgi:hypothetical protein